METRARGESGIAATQRRQVFKVREGLFKK
jgi:hypothetical protein